MPEVQRLPFRMDCSGGLDLVRPADRMQPGTFQWLLNVRVIVEGRLDARPGYTLLKGVGTANHSLRRLNSSIINAYAYFLGTGTVLFFGTEATLAQIDTGFSGNPLSLIPFRPDQSPEAWMYIYDSGKQEKVDITGSASLRPIGVVPPEFPPDINYGQPAWVQINLGSTTTGWVVSADSGAGTTIALADRILPTTITPAVILQVEPLGFQILGMTAAGNVAAGMNIVLGGETVTVKEYHGADSGNFISGIQYDSGSTGFCSITVEFLSNNLARNSIVQIGGENILVLSVTPSADGTSTSFRCFTTGTHAPADSVTSLISMLVFANTQWPTGTSFINKALEVANIPVPAIATTPVIVSAALLTTVNAGSANNRTISVADDWMHVSFFVVQFPERITQLQFQIDVDPSTAALADAFTENYYTWTIRQAAATDFTGSVQQLNVGWNEIWLPISSAVRSGSNSQATLGTIRAIQILVQENTVISFSFDDWYLSGTYGPTIQPNAPTGYLYTTTYRDSSTGAASVPGPITRYQLFPLREEILITPQPTNAVGVDYIDIYRQGGTLTDFVFVGTVQNNFSSANFFADTQSDAVVASNPTVDLTLIQPWPILIPPLSGVVSIIGTSVILESGDQFPKNLLANTVINIAGAIYQLYGQPRTATFLEVSASGGVQLNVPYTIASPTIAGQSLPFVFGPLEGPFNPVVFGLGDPNNEGTLYYCNPSNLDAAADTNTLELTSPSEPLISGDVWNGLCFCGSRDNLFLVRYSYLATIGASSNLTYQFNRLPVPSGIWSRWACKAGPDGVYYLGRDGIYKATDAGSVSITDERLYTLFPHDGQAATPITTIPATGTLIYPVDMNSLTDLRISICDHDLFFDYKDIVDQHVTLRYEIEQKRWFLHKYADPAVIHYLNEGLSNSPNPVQILQLSSTKLLLSGGDNDNGTPIQSAFALPALDSGDERGQKLYQDYIVDAEGTGVLSSGLLFNDLEQSQSAANNTVAGIRQQFINNVWTSALGFQLYRNISAFFSWTGGPSGPKVYAFEPSFYIQPYLSTEVITQYINLSFPGWKHHRRLYAALISNSIVTLTIRTQDGRVFTYQIPSTNGQFRILTQMLDHGIKDLAFSYQLSSGIPFALFPEEFVIEAKQWVEESYIQLAVFQS